VVRMQTEGEDKIIKTMEKVCKQQENGEVFFDILEKIYNHISKHENEPSDNRAQSIKDIIDSKRKGGE